LSARYEAGARERGDDGRVTTTAPFPGPALLADARRQASAVAAEAAVRIRPLEGLAAVRSAEALFVRIWRTEADRPPVAAEVLRAVEHAGGYVAGAYDGSELVGASSGFLGLAPELTLHSHISGVTIPGRGIGLALKLHQRAWALERGIETVTWTFDPLVRRNAWFNLVKLGAVGLEYLVDFYGPMPDGLNGGAASDRLFTRWDLTSAPPAGGAADPADAVSVVEERDGFPWPAAPLPAAGRPVLVSVPDDVERLRVSQPAAADAWRVAVRDALVPAFADGYRATGVTRDGRFVLTR
jgi:predicted GNAT superfamily acetyltransferase